MLDVVFLTMQWAPNLAELAKIYSEKILKSMKKTVNKTVCYTVYVN